VVTVTAAGGDASAARARSRAGTAQQPRGPLGLPVPDCAV